LAGAFVWFSIIGLSSGCRDNRTDDLWLRDPMQHGLRFANGSLDSPGYRRKKSPGANTDGSNIRMRTPHEQAARIWLAIFVFRSARRCRDHAFNRT
jgi:hypothetical protein